MAQQLNETRISIRGETIQLRTDLDGDRVNNLATYVANTMDRLDPKEVLPMNKLSLLTALSLAEEVQEAKQDGSSQNKLVVEKIGKLTALLDDALKSL